MIKSKFSNYPVVLTLLVGIILLFGFSGYFYYFDNKKAHSIYILILACFLSVFYLVGLFRFQKDVLKIIFEPEYVRVIKPVSLINRKIFYQDIKNIKIMVGSEVFLNAVDAYEYVNSLKQPLPAINIYFCDEVISGNAFLPNTQKAIIKAFIEYSS